MSFILRMKQSKMNLHTMQNNSKIKLFFVIVIIHLHQIFLNFFTENINILTRKYTFFKKQKTAEAVF